MDLVPELMEENLQAIYSMFVRNFLFFIYEQVNIKRKPIVLTVLAPQSSLYKFKQYQIIF